MGRAGFYLFQCYELVLTSFYDAFVGCDHFLIKCDVLSSLEDRVCLEYEQGILSGPLI